MKKIAAKVLHGFYCLLFLLCITVFAACEKTQLSDKPRVPSDVASELTGEGAVGDSHVPSPEGTNLFSVQTATEGVYLRFGKIIEMDTCMVTDYIPVKAGQIVHVVAAEHDFKEIVTLFTFYNIDKNFNGEVNRGQCRFAAFADGTLNYSYTVPEGTYYLRVNIQCTARERVVVALGEMTMESYYKLLGRNIPTPTYGVLYGKSALFVGDSICYAAAHELLEYQKTAGWTGRIGSANNMRWKNAGVSGTSIAITSRGMICTQLEINFGTSYDYVIIQGMTNDAIAGIPVGSVTPAGTVEYDRTTFAGALEHLFSLAKQLYPNAKYGFIITYQQPNGQYSINQHDMSKYVTAAISVCEKWGIPYLNLYDDTELNTTLQSNNYFDDGTHINSAGYNLITPIIQKWMEGI